MKSNLVFLCGFTSSGTDLLKNIVNAHSDIYISGEFPFLPRLAKKYGSTVSQEMLPSVIEDLGKIDVYHNLQKPDLKLTDFEEKSQYSLDEVYLQMLSNSSVKWIGNKTPQNTENIDKLNSLFPEAKFILIVRDVRDIVISRQKKWGKNLLLGSSKWSQRMQRGLTNLQSLPKERYLILTYENLLKDLEGSLDKICTFLEVEYQQEMLNFHQYIPQKYYGKKNYGEPLVKNNTEKWRQELSDLEIKRIEEITFPVLKFFDYPITKATNPRFINNQEKIFGYVHDIFSLVFVGNRFITEGTVSHRLKSIIFQIKKQFYFN